VKSFRSIFLILLFVGFFLSLAPFFHSLRLRIFSLFFQPSTSIQEEHLCLQNPAASSEIVALQHQISALSWQVLQLQEQVQNLTKFREKFSIEDMPLVIPAKILLRHDSSTLRNSFIIDRGSQHGVKPGFAVVYGYSLLGRILEVSPKTSKVLHITDPAMRIGIYVIGTVEDQTITYAEGLCIGRNSNCELRHIEKGNQKWQEGELSIVTSGFKKQFPPGLVVGTIQSPYRKKTGAELEEIGVFWDLPVQIADLSKILTVLVLPSLE